jgi:hypothetical protein
MSAIVTDAEDEAIALSAQRDASRSGSEIISEGVLAGMVAASAVAGVFLIVDLIAGEAFRTPLQLGNMLLSLVGGTPGSGEMATPIALYTLFHFVAFIGAGVVAAAIVHMAMKQPVAILLFIILFFAFEVAFTGFVAYLDVTSSRGMTPTQVAIGNVVASVAMALFFRARHPKLRALGRALANEE